MKRLVSCLSFLFLLNTSVHSANNDFLPVVSIPAIASPRGVAVGNIFGKDNPSFIVANFGSSTFIGQSTPATLFNPQKSTLQIFSPSPNGLKLIETIQTASSPRGVCVFDMDNQGRGDILVTAYEANLLQVFSWEKGQFIKINEENTLKMPVGVAAGLTSSNGIPFVAVANYGSGSLSLFQVKDGKLGRRIDIPVGGGPTQVAVGDLNGDGINEIAVVCLLSHRIVILAKNPTSKEDDLTAYSVTKTFDLPEGSAPADLRIADLNNDGRLDLVSADFSKNTVLIYLQQKDGSLLSQTPLLTSGNHPNGLTVADLNGDGGREIIVANRDSDSADIFQWAGSQFQLIKTLKVTDDLDNSFGPIEIGALDTKGQGKLDLVFSHMRSNTIKVLAQVPLSNSISKAQLLSGVENESSFSEKTTFCYPNPSHDGKVKFSFELNASSDVRIQIFDVRGESVWSQNLGASQTQNGINTISWDGVNQNRERLASGIYLYRITVKNYSVTKKVALIH